MTQSSWFPIKLRTLERIGHLDSLYFALWSFAKRRRGLSLPHPSLLYEAIGKVVLTRAAVASRARQLLNAAPALAKTWGAQHDWMRTGAGKPWDKGACSLLRILRARWLEGIAAVLESKLNERVGAHDKIEASLCSAILQWQYSGRQSLIHPFSPHATPPLFPTHHSNTFLAIPPKQGCRRTRARLRDPDESGQRAAHKSRRRPRPRRVGCA